jgi:hypothetical protein
MNFDTNPSSLDVYRDAAVHNVIVLGGSIASVGSSGGYLTGGGHSMFAHFYGLAADIESFPEDLAQ